MRKRVNKIFWPLVFVLVFLVFRSWFGLKEISAGDAGFYFLETLKDFPSFPYLWSSYGLGSYSSLLSSFPYFFLPLKLLSFLGLPWVLIERIAWYWLFLGLSIFSSWYLLKIVLPKAKFKFLTPFIYLFNTYILMIVGGGQVSIFLPYAIAPLVLGLFIQLVNYSIVDCGLRIKKAIIAGVALALLVSFEPRIAFITIIALGVYCLLFINELKSLRVLGSLVFSFLITFLLHFYWILPSLVLRKTSFSPTLTSGGWAEFLSFARFSDSVSLLHPNWPENIFGKTYFFRPEFLVLPVLAFISLLFTNKLKNLRVKKDVLFFALLALIGAFLAKGANPPFGEIYLWLFKNIPGMNLFRDPTKFYILVALSYSVLIPFSIEKIYKRLSVVCNMPHVTRYLPKVFLLLATCCLLLLIKPAVLGQLGGTFKAKTVPQEYVVLKDFIHSQEEFFRTFWVPKGQRFGFYANNHPAISTENFVTDSVCQEPFCSLKVEMPEKWGENCQTNERCYVRELSYFLNPKTAEVLSQMAVKYIIVPFDSEGEIFIAEHQYNHQQREEVEEFLDTIPWLKKIDVAEKIAVYELPEFKDHFFGIGEEIPEIQWQMINPTKYKIQIKDAAQPFKLVFSETYDELWQARLDSRPLRRIEASSARLAKIGGRIIPSMRYNNLNSFSVDQAGDFEIVVEFTAQKYVYWGLVVSAFTLLMSAGVLVYLWRK